MHYFSQSKCWVTDKVKRKMNIMFPFTISHIFQVATICRICDSFTLIARSLAATCVSGKLWSIHPCTDTLDQDRKTLKLIIRVSGLNPSRGTVIYI